MLKNGTIFSLRHKRFIGSLNKSNGYCSVGYGIYKNMIHRIIWMVANGCDIPEGYHIHHIDGNKLNNSIYNLELVQGNEHLSEHNKGKIVSEETKKKMSLKGRNNPKKSIKIGQYTLNGELIKVWDSIREADRNGFNRNRIRLCCLNENNLHRGYKWKIIDYGNG